ncbi:hypothetical protein [Spirochaeta cellobiosiphila]|uniref:hypothetical protein n=1 Tax=Spirochaeta cellobiosiphila TaxID=504483 RepID=UPI00041430D5|nr:hypothetical protein [Spirochaeta cellobiosiphila]
MRFDSSRFRAFVIDKQDKALANQSLQSFHTTRYYLKIEESIILIRMMDKSLDSNRLHRKKRSYTPPESPFIPPEDDLFIGSLNEEYNIILNKYNVCENHILLVTKEFEYQNTPLEWKDFEAAWLSLQGSKALVFYNSSSIAGASQQHRHLQWLPLPLFDELNTDPIIFVKQYLDTHLIVGIKEFTTLPTAKELYEIYQNLLSRLKSQCKQSEHYNLLLTHKGMALIPRHSSQVEGISINSLAFCGSLFVTNEQQKEYIETKGLRDLLKQAAYPV